MAATLVALSAPGIAQDLLSVSPSVIQFSSSAVGVTQSESYVGIGNSLSVPVIIQSIAVSGGNATDFAITGDECVPLPSGQLGSGIGCQVFLSFTPSAVGERVSQLVISTQGGSAQGVLLVGQGLALNEAFTVSPQNVSFPSTPLGLPADVAPSGSIQITNSGDAPLTIESTVVVGADAGDFQITQNACKPSLTIPLSNSCSLTIAFQPVAEGLRSAYLAISSDASGGTRYLALSGAGSPPISQLQIDAAFISFADTVIGSSAQSFVYVQNTGSEPVTVQTVEIVGTNAGDFSIAYNGCGATFPFTITAQQMCPITFQFSPSAVGERSAQVAITDSATGSPQETQLLGIGQAAAPNISWTGPFVNFGAATVGQPVEQPATLANTGNTTAQVLLRVQGADASDFQIAPGGCGTSIGPNTGCQFVIQFTPSAPGVRAAVVSATDSVSGQIVYLSLVGYAQSIVPALTVTQIPAFFSSTLVGTTAEPAQMSVVNSGSSETTISGVALSGAQAAQFHIVQNGCAAGTVLSPSSSCSLQLTFAPTAPGISATIIGVGYSGSATPVVVPVVAQGAPPANGITFTPIFSPAAATAVGESVQYSVTITATGNIPVAISAISIAGTASSSFTIAQSTCPSSPTTLAPQQSCQVTIQFTPTAAGTSQASLQITDNAPGSPQSLPMVGFGVSESPGISLPESTLNFGVQPLGSSFQQFAGISSLGSVPLTLSSISITGPDASDFSLANGCPSSLSSSGCQLSVTFTPSVTGLRLAQLQIVDNAPGSPHFIPLSGIGAQAIRSVSFAPLASFPILAVGQTSTTSVTLTSSGTAPVLLSSTQITGQNAADFAIQSSTCPVSPAPFAASATCQLVIRFQPSAASVRVAALVVTDNALGGEQSISLIGEGERSVKVLQISATTSSFPSTPVGSTAFSGAPVQLANVGTAPVTISSISFTGANKGDFGVQSNCLVSPLTTTWPDVCSLSFSFTPSSAGTRTATAVISSDALNNPLTVTLSGTGQ